MQRYTSAAVVRALLGALMLLWLAAQVVTLAHQLDVEKHPASCDWCLTHASVGHALGTTPPVLPPVGVAPLALALVLVVVALRFVPVYQGRAPPR
jgi:uncharacterized membrane protein